MKRKRHGLMTIDALAGLMLLGALASALAVGTNVSRRAARQFASQREALLVAQQTVDALRVGSTIPTSDDVVIARTGPRVGDREWIEITVTKNSRRATLAALVPATQPT